MSDALPTILAAGVAALLGYFFALRQNELGERRKECATALADAMSWLELAYRVRRRPDDDPETRTALVERMHDLQEAIYFHQNWLQVQMPDSASSYEALVRRVKDSARQQIQEAWEAAPLKSSSLMNLGDLGIESKATEVREVATRMRRELSWWRLWRF